MLDGVESMALAALVEQTGRPGFADRMMQALNALCAADMCSGFAIPDGEPEILFAQSTADEMSAFARIATLRYATTYWKRDTATAATLGRAHHSVRTTRRPASVIRDLDYRHECYAEGGVVERISICRSGEVPVIVNAYRSRASDAFAPHEIERLERVSPVIVALVERHRALAGSDGPSPLGDPLALAQRLKRGAPGLSLREAQVLARTLAGDDRNAIARALGITVNSVVTYRRRGYAKFAVRSRGELRARVEAM